MKEYDFIAIGGGSAGLGAARMVRNAGRTVAVLDQGPVRPEWLQSDPSGKK